MPSLEPVAQAVCRRYNLQFERKVGAGTFKETFLSVADEGQQVAIKVYRPEQFDSRALREVQAMQRCNHPSIARLYKANAEMVAGRQYPYVLEEYLGGGTLEDRLKGGLLPAPTLYQLGLDLIAAVAHIASLDLVHRDLKPQNILFRAGEDLPVITDFGIVRDLADTSLTPTFLTSGPGTRIYASPEQLNNDKTAQDWRTDQFALGVILAWAHFGDHPYAVSGDSRAEVVERVAQRQGPAKVFVEKAANSKFPVLVRMVHPWPVRRYGRPNDLVESWKAQRSL